MPNLQPGALLGNYIAGSLMGGDTPMIGGLGTADEATA